MDFSRPHLLEESVATKSKIRYIPTTSTTSTTTSTSVDNNADNNKNNNCNHTSSSSSLDCRLVEAANRAAKDILLGPVTDPDPRRIDAALYPERYTPQSETIQAGHLVVIFESFDNLNFVYATPKAIFSNRNGNFHHDDFIGQPFGCKLRSRNNRGYGFCYLLKPTPELWARSLNHRTQIVHELDASMIVFYLQLKPNMVVCETGTGSGAMSHAILRTIAPQGKLHTFEFNALRAEQARVEFAKNGLSHLVSVYHKDVCGKTTTTTTTKDDDDDAGTNDNSKKTSTTTAQQQQQQGGFGLEGQSVSAVFLDLPEPWLAIPHAAYCLKANGRIASYSPCVEQTQRTVVAMRKAGFHSIKTMEFRIRENYVDEVEYELPPREKRPRTEPHNNNNNVAAAAATANTTGPLAAAAAAAAADADAGNNNSEPYLSEGGEDTGAEADNEKSEMSETEADQLSLATAGTAEEMALLDEAMANKNAMDTTTLTAAPAAVVPKSTTTTTTTTLAPPNNNNNNNINTTGATAVSLGTAATTTTITGSGNINGNNNNNNGGKRKKMLVARPFVMMRGHTAFLTFATAGNLVQPDPNKVA